jgi:SH2 domain
MAHDSTRASAVNYFYGRISRDEAESILSREGCKEGLFLLRENVSCAGNYALSICHNGRLVDLNGIRT